MAEDYASIREGARQALANGDSQAAFRQFPGHFEGASWSEVWEVSGG